MSMPARRPRTTKAARAAVPASGGGVPALARGLRILEMVGATEQPVSFTDIARALRLSNTSTARLLRVLLEHGMIVKHDVTGHYLLGARLKELTGIRSSVINQLRHQGQALLEGLSQATNTTALLVYWNGEVCIAIAKSIVESSITMQSVGTVSATLSRTPWGWLFYQTLTPAGRATHRQFITHPDQFQTQLRAHQRFFETHGYAYDDCTDEPLVRRLAAPVYRDGEVVACVCLGGNVALMPDKKIAEYGAQVVACAQALSARLVAGAASDDYVANVTLTQ